MPYYRRRYYRKRSYRKYPRKGNGSTDYIRMAKAAYTGVKYLKSLVNVEKKFLDNSFVHNPDNVTGVFSLLNALNQGDGPSQRDGNSVKSWKFNVNMKFTINASANHTSIRVIIFIDKECNGSSVTVNDILNASNLLANYNHNESMRFNTLYDRTISLSSTGVQEINLRCFRKIGFHTKYDGPTASLTDMTDNALWIYTISDQPTTTPTVTIRSQYLYLDN